MLDWQDEFDLDPDLIYLNHAAVAPWPRRAQKAVARFALENATRGAADYPKWMTVEQRVRELFGQLINTHSDNISLLKNTSEGLSAVAYGLDLSPGDEIVGIADDFPSNRILWESLASKGVKFHGQLLGPRDPDPEARLLAAVTDNTRLLAVSSVHYATGLRLDLERLGRFCRSRGILFCVDAIQSLGIVPFDIEAIQADFVAADGHKWLLGPEGVALFYCRPELRESLKLHQYGWHMMADPGDFGADDWQLADSGRRFEAGSPNMLGLHALAASLELITSTGVSTIEESVNKNVEYLIDLVNDNPSTSLVTPGNRERRAGILSLQMKDVDPEVVWRELMSRDVICAARGGYLRFSPHAYTEFRQLERAMEVLTSIL